MHLRRGRTIVELLVMGVCIVIIVTVIIGVFGPNRYRRRFARSLKDQVMLVQIHKAMLTYAGAFNGRLPLPSLGHRYPLGEEIDSGFDPFEIEQDYSLNTTGNLYSMMIMHQLIPAKILISPVEINLVVEELTEFDFETYKPVEGVYWDDRFRVEIDGREGEAVCHTSYAHLALCGERVRRAWRDTQSGDSVVLANRGTKNGVMEGAEYEKSPTLEFHQSRDQWVGNVVLADNHSVFSKGFFLKEVSYFPPVQNSADYGTPQPQPDNIFAAEFNEYPPRGKQGSSDAFLVICDAAGKDSVQAIYDRLWE